MDSGGGVVAKLGAEVFPLGTELGDDRRVGAEPDIEFLEGIVVDEIELDVLVAPALAGCRIGCAQQVEFGAPVGCGLLLCFCGLRDILRCGGCLRE